VPHSLVAQKRRLQGHVQQGGDIKKADLRSGQAFQSVWEGVSFTDSRLSMVDFRASKWVNCHLTDTDIYGASFNAGALHDVTFTGCDGEQVSFAGAVLHNVIFRDCRLAYSSFVGASLSGVMFESCNLHGGDLDYAVANGVSYLKSNLWAAKTTFGCAFWSSTFGVDDCERFAALLARVHPDPSAKEALMRMAGSRTYNAVCRLMESTDGDAPEF
jgi:uncharacterized protein YjbI with pentapeptide repeats